MLSFSCYHGGIVFPFLVCFLGSIAISCARRRKINTYLYFQYEIIKVKPRWSIYLIDIVLAVLSNTIIDVTKNTALWPGTFPNLRTLLRVPSIFPGCYERLRWQVTDGKICGSRSGPLEYALKVLQLLPLLLIMLALSTNSTNRVQIKYYCRVFVTYLPLLFFLLFPEHEHEHEHEHGYAREGTIFFRV